MTDSASKLDPKSNLPLRSNSNDPLSELKKQRGTIKGRLTLFEKSISKFNSDSPLMSVQKAKLRLRIRSAEEMFQNFNLIQTNIENSSDDIELANQLDYRECFETQYFNIMATAKLLVEDCSDSSRHTHSRSVSAVTSAIKLPEIKLPVFDGSYDLWLEFRNSYITMIHTRTDLDNIQKFHYLRSALTGSASQVIGALEFTAPNYIHAWDLLENRFNNPRLLVHNHDKALFILSSINKESPVQIRKLMDNVSRNLRALKTLNEPTDEWDTLIIYLIVSKLDPSTEREWEIYKGSIASSLQGDSKVTTRLNDLLTFLKNRADMLEMININYSKNTGASNKTSHPKINYFDSKKPVAREQQMHSFLSTRNDTLNDKRSRKFITPCILCKANHALYMCTTFLNLPISDRLKLIDDKKLCTNCLRAGHTVTSCLFGTCKYCQHKHNSLLHLNTIDGSNGAHESTHAHHEPTDRNALTTAALASTALHTNIQCSDCIPNKNASNSLGLTSVLLCTALIEVTVKGENRYCTARALLDNGSQHCFISTKFCKRFNIPLIQSTVRISGVGQSVTQSNQSCEIIIRSKTSDYYTDITCLVLPCITSKLPANGISIDTLRIPDNIQLADPSFSTPSEIDLLIGADIFWDLLNADKIRLSNGPYLQSSKLGWLISGPVYTKSLLSKHIQRNFVQNIDSQLRKFWELEDIPKKDNILTKDERACEELFIKTTKREENGRFSVRIPFKESTNSLGDSYASAKKRFESTERKLARSPNYKKKYVDFMREYIDLGHMSRIDKYEWPYCFLPHHGVIRESSSTTKLRVVFDASASTSSNKSLNDIQLIGPPLQNDIFSILLRFRWHKHVACADIEKMYRQILVQPDQRNLQLILWRENSDEALHVYRLNTVTYGKASAPYLSMRCLKQLAQECGDDIISQIINNDFFVDDLITGCDDNSKLLQMCQKTSQILQSACFPLRKWTFSGDVPTSQYKEFSNDEHTQSKTLGVGWNSKSDELHFTTKVQQPTILTKRGMLSIISQIYDPLGLLAPTVIISKILLQKLWLSKIDWDDTVPNEIAMTWNYWVNTLQYLHNLSIPRHVRGERNDHTELHIFTDASQDAYGTCAYIRTYSENSTITVRLLCAKGKVSPLKTISIPRLELCGALLGAKLYKRITESLSLRFDIVYFWTDSTIVMRWLRMSPHLLKTFVQNRVTEINELTGDTVWLHVNGRENPADLVSRGLHFDALNNCSLWWKGPAFLHGRDFELQKSDASIEHIDLPELKLNKTTALVCGEVDEFINFERFSSFRRLVRAGAYVLRFIRNARGPNIADRQIGPLSANELDASRLMLARIVQMQSFPNIYKNLVNELPVTYKNKSIRALSGLNVFFDKTQLIRVGGRLCNSTTFDYNKKHPILLCSKHRFTTLLFKYEHIRLLHAGPQLLVASVRECWWALGARNLARKIVYQCVTCVTCARFRGRALVPIMGNLPSDRLEPTFPFMRTGVDYAGPVFMLNRRGRGSTRVKGYICLFICFATRAIHLELVSSLSTNDYLLALKRFISRRGKPSIIFSDNGKNFVGAEKEISSILMYDSAKIIDYAASDGITFKFSPPYANHFGGLWEAGVKSCKHHLKRILGNAKLTYEELSTVLTQIEAVLNSRPMSSLSTNPNDYSPLTPAHFLIGRPLTAPAGEDLTARNSLSLARYSRVELLRQHFWRRWSKEYVSEMQVRTKWKAHKTDIASNSLVLIKDDNLPPLKWRLGRVERTFPGTDGIVRVADIRTTNGIVKRAFSKICPLPLQPEETRD